MWLCLMEGVGVVGAQRQRLPKIQKVISEAA